MSELLSGADAPLVPVYCGLCDLIVERLRFERQQSPWAWSFWAQCCGKTVSMRVPMGDILRMSRTGEKLFAVVGKGHAQTIKKLASFEKPKAPRVSVALPGLWKARG